MFKCAITGQMSKPREKPVKLIVARRERVYTERQGDQEVVIGRGWEIVKQVEMTLDGLGVWCKQHLEDSESAALYVRLVRAEKLKREAELRRGNQPNLDRAA